MKILFTGPLLDFSGFAHASRNFLHSLEASSKFDLAARALTYDRLDGTDRFVPDAWLKTLLNNDLQNVDMAIQMTTCNNEAQIIPGICNGLYTFLESDRVQFTWAQRANEFDFLMVPCRHNAEALMRSGVTTPILVVPPSCDTSVYTKHRKPFQLENAGDRTVFYSICQLSAKKGIDALLKAYFAAFADSPDDVLLVLKTYINMQNRSQDMEAIKRYIAQIKQGCRIPVQKYPPVLPMVDIMSDDDIHALHERGHAYVCSSRAEGWCIPAFDSLGHGNLLITNARTGLEGFVRQEHALIYDGAETFFFDMHHPDPGLFTGLEQCFEPSPVQMAFLMRKYHDLRTKAMSNTLNADEQQEWDAILQRQENARNVVSSFHYENTHDKVTPQLEIILEKWRNGLAIEFEQGVPDDGSDSPGSVGLAESIEQVVE